MSIHLWDVLEAPRASAAEVRAKLRLGWQLYRLPDAMTYCSAGGAGLYSHVLAGPHNEMRQLTVRALPDPLPPCPVLALQMDTLALQVPYADKDLAKARGAKWQSDRKAWCIRPCDAPLFAQWLPDGALTEDAAAAGHAPRP